MHYQSWYYKCDACLWLTIQSSCVLIIPLKRTQVVALLFRSLISDPPEVCAAATSSLHSALTLCVPSKETEDGSASSKGHGLPKDLIQSCIRPILLNLVSFKFLRLSLFSWMLLSLNQFVSCLTIRNFDLTHCHVCCERGITKTYQFHYWEVCRDCWTFCLLGSTNH